ncbi:MAG: nucleotidyltransferase family protein [Microcoleaceae cyanobacterium]
MFIHAKDLKQNQSPLSLEEIYQRLNTGPTQIVNFCEKWQIVELALFGSILRDDFQVVGENKSDVDILFTYGAMARKNLILQVRMQYELEDIFNRSVDLVSKTALEQDANYIRRHNILNSARIIYGTR